MTVPDRSRNRLLRAYTAAGFGEAAYQQRLAQARQQQQGGRWVQGAREPLTAGQHILHLLLTVVTAGLWSPVWVVRAVQGNRKWRWEPAPRQRPT